MVGATLLRHCAMVLRQNQLPSNYVHLVINVGDCGPDQTGARSYLRTLLSRPGYEGVLFFGNACLLHQYHLIAQGSLMLLDRALKKTTQPFRYFAALATLGHCWRGNLAKLRQSAIAQGITDKQILFRLPPMAIAGRWGSIDSTIAFTSNFVFTFVLVRLGQTG